MVAKDLHELEHCKEHLKHFPGYLHSRRQFHGNPQTTGFRENRKLKVALYSFFGVQGIGTNGASTRVFKKSFYFDNVNKNKGFE